MDRQQYISPWLMGATSLKTPSHLGVLGLMSVGHDALKSLDQRIIRAVPFAAEDLPPARAAFTTATAVFAAVGLTNITFAIARRWNF